MFPHFSLQQKSCTSVETVQPWQELRNVFITQIPQYTRNNNKKKRLKSFDYLIHENVKNLESTFFSPKVSTDPHTIEEKHFRECIISHSLYRGSLLAASIYRGFLDWIRFCGCSAISWNFAVLIFFL